MATEPSEHPPVVAAEGHDLPAEVGHAAHPHEQPSDWGWHADFARPARIAGWITVIGLVLMTTSTHYNGAGAVALLTSAGLLVMGLAWDINRRRTSWRD